MTPLTHEVIETVIIGAGLSGLACAKRLADRGRAFVILEATDRVGGRVRTDHVDGFQLDHGFQVLLTAYPACLELLDYESLDLGVFEPGALIRQNGRFRILGDPWRRPLRAIATALNPVGTIGDKLRIARLRAASCRGSLDDLYARENIPTIDRLRRDGFSPRIIDQFFRPFLGGVFLDESLQTSSRMLEFVFRMFAQGDIAVPNDGMAAIPRQLAEKLPRGSLRLRSTVTSIRFDDSEDGVHEVAISGGERIFCHHVVVATPADTAAVLLGQPAMVRPWSGTTNVYFAAKSASDTKHSLMLRGDETGPVQTAVVLSDVASRYSPPGYSLVSVSLGSADGDAGWDTDVALRPVVEQLAGWFGESARDWRHLQTIHVPFGLPRLDLDTVLADVRGPHRGSYVIGDHVETPSIQGAFNSGLRAAEAITRVEPPTRPAGANPT